MSSFRTTVRNPSAKFLHAFDEDPNAVLEDDLRDALLHRWEPSVRSLLNRSADPNVVYWGVACGGTTFTWCTPLCIAATLGNLGIARALLEAGALPNSQYAMPSGAAKQEHTFQAAFAALPGGDLRMLRLLVDADADVGERSPTSNASLLWHAADLGHAEVVRFLAGPRCRVGVVCSVSRRLGFTVFSSAHCSCEGSSHGGGNAPRGWC